MASNVTLQAVPPGLMDPALYEEGPGPGLPAISAGALLVPLSRAFDLAEGRRPGHAQRVAYIAWYLARETKLGQAAQEEAFFAALLHDAGMATASRALPRTERAPSRLLGSARAREIFGPAPAGGWPEVLEAMRKHAEEGARIARRLGFGEGVARAIASHHETWERRATATGQRPGPTVARIVAAADRLEGIIDGDESPLTLRRRAPAMLAEMSGQEIEPQLARRAAAAVNKDDFWLGFYDGDLADHLMGLNYGTVMEPGELFAFAGVISDMVDLRNGRRAGRGRRVAELAHRAAIGYHLPARRAEVVRLAALLQDLGTLGISPHLLSKPDILTIEEMAAVQQHTVLARDILAEVPGLGAAAWWVGCHHERLDGKGYPGMLHGDEVPIEAQLVGMAEAYDALISDRPYRRALLPHDALAVMEGMAGTRFSKDLFESFAAIVQKF
jgi:putative nucleotidyltransferase with HDIG domain